MLDVFFEMYIYVAASKMNPDSNVAGLKFWSVLYIVIMCFEVRDWLREDYTVLLVKEHEYLRVHLCSPAVRLRLVYACASENLNIHVKGNQSYLSSIQEILLLLLDFGWALSIIACVSMSPVVIWLDLLFAVLLDANDAVSWAYILSCLFLFLAVSLTSLATGILQWRDEANAWGSFLLNCIAQMVYICRNVHEGLLELWIHRWSFV